MERRFVSPQWSW